MKWTTKDAVKYINEAEDSRERDRRKTIMFPLLYSTYKISLLDYAKQSKKVDSGLRY